MEDWFEEPLDWSELGKLDSFSAGHKVPGGSSSKRYSAGGEFVAESGQGASSPGH